MDCVEEVDSFYDEWGRYRQFSFEAMTPNCRYDLVQYALSSEGIVDDTQNQTFEFVVWPTEFPIEVGELADIDAGVRFIELVGQDNFTMRISEMATATGYAWEIPAYDQFNCIELIDDNVGNFTTGYQQF